MLGGRSARTGIDLGTSSVKLVRGEGAARLRRITHVGIEQYPRDDSTSEMDRLAIALGSLLSRLRLTRGTLGRIAVAAREEEASVRDVVLPTLAESELRQALPYEARRHLSLEVMASPLLDLQVLGPAPPGETESIPQSHVLLAAVPKTCRDLSLQVLGQLHLEPEVIDLEPLAGLNALLGRFGGRRPDEAIGLLDLGARRASLNLTGRDGEIVFRQVGPGAPDPDSPQAAQEYADSLVLQVLETLTFYRGRYRLDVGSIFLAGGGCLLPGVFERFQAVVDRPVAVLNPLEGLGESAVGMAEVGGQASRLVTACGLCRWWDESNV